MKNKFLIQIINVLFMIIGLVLLMFGFPNRVIAEANNDTYFTDGNFKYYILSDTTAELTEYKGNKKEVVVPDEVNGHFITEIGDRAFADNNTLESVKLGKNITKIGNSAFVRDCTLQEVDATKCTEIERVEYGAFLNTPIYANDVDGGLVYVGNFNRHSNRSSRIVTDFSFQIG